MTIYTKFMTKLQLNGNIWNIKVVFGVRSIPSLLFVPMDEQPQMAMGALPKDTFEKAIEDVLKIKKD